MEQPTLNLKIITPERILVSEDVDSFETIGTDGEFQVLAGHTPFLTGLKIGHVSYMKSGHKNYISISGGFCEVKYNTAVILAHTAEQAAKIDKARAENAKKRAERRLEKKGDPSIDEERARLALFRALNRLRVAEFQDSKW